ncbi:MAG: site-2 protease family protein [Alphaproteobacteria bacterium]|nr:site-2 protease family protein [Alphaproteobacteria bacterium]
MFSDLSLFEISAYVIPVVLAITLHEAAHGYVAWLCGDDTAKRARRVTLNPFRHIDLFGTIVLPAILIAVGAPFFGFAKPVPVDFSRLRRRSDIALVAAAGPLANIIIALIAAGLLHGLPEVPPDARAWVLRTLQLGVTLNLALAVFNLIPVPPLDGAKVAIGLLPRPLAIAMARLDRYGILILLALVVFLPMAASQAGVAFNPFWAVVQPILGILLDVVLLVTGHR